MAACTSLTERPTALRPSAVCFEGLRIEPIMARSAVAASEAFAPVLVMPAIAAPTWSKETPIALAIGITLPSDPESSSGAILPSRTVATRTSVAALALRFLAP